MKLLIIGPQSFESRELVKAAEKRKHQVVLASIKDISFIVKKNEMDIFYHARTLKDFDVCLLRGIFPYFAIAQALMKYLYVHNVRVIDKKLIEKPHNFSKIFSAVEMVNNNVPVVDTYLFSKIDLLKKHLKKIPDEVVVKNTFGMQSRGLYSMKKIELASFFKDKPISQFMIQPKLDAKYYYRLLVVGNKVLGAIRRISYFNPNRKNVSCEKRSEKAMVSNDLEKLALNAVEAAGVEIAGVDIIVVRKEMKVLEVNRTPQFRRFMSITGINVAEHIIKYLEKQNRKLELLKIT